MRVDLTNVWSKNVELELFTPSKKFRISDMVATPQTIRRFLAALVLACSFAASADAAIITQIQNNNFNVTTGTQTLNWNQFNPTLGTLVSVEYLVDGTLTGSFSVQNNDIQVATARNSQTFFFNRFLAPGTPPAAFAGTAVLPILTSPVSDITGTDIAANSTQIFTVNGPQSMTVPVTNLTASSAYFTGLGTVDSEISEIPSVSVTGGLFTVDMSGLNVVGIATLIYRYDDGIAVVPEPSAVAFAGIGLVAFAAQRFRSKKRAKATPAVA